MAGPDGVLIKRLSVFHLIRTYPKHGVGHYKIRTPLVQQIGTSNRSIKIERENPKQDPLLVIIWEGRWGRLGLLRGGGRRFHLSIDP